MKIIERIIAWLWNRLATRRGKRSRSHELDLGVVLSDGTPTRDRIALSQTRRAEHIAILGKTGQGKSRLLWTIAKQDIGSRRGFVYFDLHGDATPFLLTTIAAQERITGEDLSDRLILIEPADADYSVGLNPLAQQDGSDRFIQIAEFAEVLKQRWHLESFGARTDELLRNALYALAESGLTLLELSPFLSHAGFRAACLKNVTNPEIGQYFELRYDQASEPMRAVMREPILNKISAFTGDNRFRHIVAQQRSTFSILDAMDRGAWVILNLHKGRLGEQAATLGSLFLTMAKNALFSRTSRELFTIFCDEAQNLITFGNELETVLSEARKFSVAMVACRQFLEQAPPEMRAALFAVSTHVFFQLSAPDAREIAAALDGGKPLVELLKNLPRRHMVVKTGHERWREVIVPQVAEPKVDSSGLCLRSRARWARKRSEVEAEIAHRQAIVARDTKEALNEWE